MEKCIIFIDGGYLASALRDFGNPKIDHLKFCNYLCGLCDCDVRRVRTYYYDCLPYQSNPPTPEEKERYSKKQRFMTMLKRLPRFEIKLGRLAKYPKPDGKYGFEQKKVDILLSIDLTRVAISKQIDRVILVAGDSDFVPAIQVAKDAGAITQLVYFPRTVHNELLDACDERIELSQENIQKILKNKI